jgi:hypothetical protein
VSDYSGHLIRHFLNASEAFPTEWFLQFWEQVKVWWAHVRNLRRVGKHLPPILFQNFRYCAWGMRPRLIVIWLQSVSSSISRLRFAEQEPRSLSIYTQCSLQKSGSQMARKSERLHHPTGRASSVCRTFEMTYLLLWCSAASVTAEWRLSSTHTRKLPDDVHTSKHSEAVECINKLSE